MTVRQQTGPIHRKARIAAIVMSAILAITAIYCGINLMAVRSYNQATQSLISNIKAFRSPGADLDTLRTRQQQTDDQFGEANALNPVLLPSVRRPIETNTDISRTLTGRIDSALTQQNKSKTSDSSPSPSSSPTAANGSSLSNEQRKKVEELLKANEQSAQKGNGQGNGQRSKDQAPAKPW